MTREETWEERHQKILLQKRAYYQRHAPRLRELARQYRASKKPEEKA